MKKRIISMLLAAVMTTGTLSACSTQPENTEAMESTVGMEIIGGFEETTTERTTEDTTTPVVVTTTTTTTTKQFTTTEFDDSVFDDLFGDLEDTEATSETTTPVTEVPVTTTTTVGTTGKPIETVNADLIFDTEKHYGKKIIYKQLSDRDQKIYDKLVAAVRERKASVSFGEKLTEDEYHRIFCIAFYQNPELFWWQGTLMMNDEGTKGILSYLYNEEQVKSYQALIDKKVKTLTAKLTDGMSDLQKVLVCHNWLCVNNTFSKDSKHSKNVYGAIADGTAQCEGYAKAMLYLMNKIGVPCILSTGANKDDASHAWVKVYINGEWTNVDPTFDDSTMPPPIDYTNVSYRYMGVPDSAIYGITHLYPNTSPIDHTITLFETPACTTYSLNADINYGNYAETYEEAFEKLKAACFTAVENKQRCAHVKVATDAVYKEALNKLAAEKQVLNIKKAINEKFGADTISSIAMAPENSLYYIEVTMTYGGAA